MNKRITKLSILVAASITALLIAGTLFAKGGGTTYTWYDGQIARKVYVVPGHVAEIVQSGSISRMRSADPGARQASPARGKIRIWKIAANSKALSARSGIKTSPVFSDRAGGAVKRALVGNVIVRLNSNWSDARVASWAKSRKLTIVRTLPLLGNWIVVASPAGLASLTLANQLHARSDVIQAQPNWWTDVRTR